MKIVLISCVALKQNIACKAKDMYISPLFKGAYKYAKKLNADKIFILSAKYGLLAEDEIIQPYNETLNTKSVSEIRAWSEEVVAKLSAFADLENDEFVFLAGAKYRKFIVQHIKHYSVPLQNLGIGKQLAFYKENT